ncbi:MAG: histidine kinase [Acidobacteriota bacterium]|nr:histidine kinase [Acidobacteriota bacterium]
MQPALSRATALILLTVLIKLGVIASLASITARFGHFRRLLFVEQRTPWQKVQFALFLGIPFMLGVVTRVLAGYQGADLSLEITVLGGLLGGTVVGLMVGFLVSLPAALIGHEFLALPMAALYALVAGSARWLCPDKEGIWEFSPFIDLTLFRSIKLRFKQPALDWQVLFALMVVVLEIVRLDVGPLVKPSLFYLSSPHYWTDILIVFATLVGVGLPVKIWNGTRIELKLEDQHRMLLQARMDALVSQINPHFLFNTLNTISSLIRMDPDTARSVLLKLSRILRRRLKVQAHFLPLKEELDFIDDYLDIEVVRFGPDKLRIRKEIKPECQDVVVPSMILQPLVENAIRHGIAPKIEGGSITLRARRNRHRLVIEVEDDGIGIPPDRRHEIYASGIGIRNVTERLRVLFGDQFSLKVDSQPGKGTLVSFEIPELVVKENAAAREPTATLE